MEILIDTNFIITCVKQNIDFVARADDIIDEEISWIVPQDVLNELGNLKNRKGIKMEDKRAAVLSFEVLKNIRAEIIELPGENPNIDIKIVNYLLDKDIVLATLDKDLKGRVKNKILTIRAGKKLGFV
ncbi:MAG: hypothetical protein ABIF88_03410 [archaeon]